MQPIAIASGCFAKKSELRVDVLFLGVKCAKKF